MNPIQSELHAEIQPDPPHPAFPSSGPSTKSRPSPTQKARPSRHHAGVTTASLTMHRVSLAELRAQPELLEAHWREVRRHSPLSFAVAWEAYEQIGPRAVGVFDDGRMVGYGLGYMTAGLHSKHDLTFQVDAIYLDPAYRLRGVADQLLNTLLADVDPALPVVAHATVGSAAEAFLVRRGFTEMERVFIKANKD